jgi:hypothetical protein
VAVEAAHAQQLQQHVDDQGVVGGDDQFDVAGVAGAFESLVAAGGADRVAVVGGDAQERVVESAAQGPLLLVVNLGLVDFADAESAQFVGEDEAELNLRDLEPLTHGVDVIHHC